MMGCYQTFLFKVSKALSRHGTGPSHLRVESIYKCSDGMKYRYPQQDVLLLEKTQINKKLIAFTHMPTSPRLPPIL